MTNNFVKNLKMYKKFQYVQVRVVKLARNQIVLFTKLGISQFQKLQKLRKLRIYILEMEKIWRSRIQ